MCCRLILQSLTFLTSRFESGQRVRAAILPGADVENLQADRSQLLKETFRARAGWNQVSQPV
jgi:predicted nucleic acid-binding Zn ribbon protein